MHYHFIAIGGAAMHNLAMALHDNGHKVTGSDDKIFDPSRGRLKAKGLLPSKEGWFTEKITKDIEAVVLGMHAKKDNPELLKAQELDLKIYSYPELIYEMSKDKTRVVIGGSHGKTTITSMILHVLNYYEKEFDYMVGAQLEGFDNMVRLSDAPLIILEGDEYLASPLDPRPKFHIYKPQIALISGIAWDHINVFPSKEAYELQFKIFCELMEDVGTLVYNETDEAVKKIAESESKRLFLLPYSFTEYQVKNGQTLINFNGREYELNIFGKHNLLNMEGARKICRRLGINNRMFFQSMKSFEGASNRLEVYRTDRGIVYRDFAHAPSKLEATVDAVKKNHPKVPLVAVFELHTYRSLNAEFLPEYKKTMDEADMPVVFFTHETLAHKNLPALNEEQVKKHFGLDKKLKVFTDPKVLEDFLMKIDYPKFNLLMMSSGTFAGLEFEKIVKQLFPKKKRK